MLEHEHIETLERKPSAVGTILGGLLALVPFAYAIALPTLILAGDSGPLQRLVYFAVSVGAAGGLTWGLCRLSGLSLRECRITPPRFTLRGVAVALLLPATFLVIITRLPGRWVWNGLSPAQALGALTAMFLMTGFTPGITEELFFRGYLLRRCERRWSKPVALLFTTVLFCLMHAGGQVPAAVMWGRLALSATHGLLFGLATYRAGHIWDAVLIHALWNAFVGSQHLISVGPEVFPDAFVSYVSPEAWAWQMDGRSYLIICPLILAGVCFYLYSLRKAARRSQYP